MRATAEKSNILNLLADHGKGFSPGLVRVSGAADGVSMPRPVPRRAANISLVQRSKEEP